MSEQEGPRCEQAAYPKYDPGVYSAECVSSVIVKDKCFGRWVCMLKLRIVGNDGEPVCCFLNLGSREQPHAGPKSEYRRVWMLANGGPPKKRQILSKRTFVGRIFEVRLADVVRRFDRREHGDRSVYSVVREVLRRTYP